MTGALVKPQWPYPGAKGYLVTGIDCWGVRYPDKTAGAIESDSLIGIAKAVSRVNGIILRRVIGIAALIVYVSVKSIIRT